MQLNSAFKKISKIASPVVEQHCLTNLYQNDGKKNVRRRVGTAHYPKHNTSSVKNGGGRVMHGVTEAAA